MNLNWHRNGNGLSNRIVNTSHRCKCIVSETTETVTVCQCAMPSDDEVNCEQSCRWERPERESATGEQCRIQMCTICGTWPDAETNASNFMVQKATNNWNGSIAKLLPFAKILHYSKLCAGWRPLYWSAHTMQFIGPFYLISFARFARCADAIHATMQFYLHFSFGFTRAALGPLGPWGHAHVPHGSCKYIITTIADFENKWKYFISHATHAPSSGGGGDCDGRKTKKWMRSCEIIHSCSSSTQRSPGYASWL